MNVSTYEYVISVATSKPSLYVFIDSELILLVYFICNNYKSLVAQKKLCSVCTLAAKSFNIREIVLPRPQTASAVIFLSRFCDLNIQITIKVRLIIIYILFNNNNNTYYVLCFPQICIQLQEI
jgi:hypothetical protein